jgi:predicted metal-binding membrane protein
MNRLRALRDAGVSIWLCLSCCWALMLVMFAVGVATSGGWRC